VSDAYRGGSGTPLVLLHGLQGSWRIWQPVLPLLEEHHALFVPTLAGHRDGPPLGAGGASVEALADALERALDDEGLDTVHLAGNSLGGAVALELARRGRARSLVLLSPAGGWASDKDLKRVIRLLTVGRKMLMLGGDRVAHALRRPKLRRLALRDLMVRGDRIPARALPELLDDAVACTAFDPFMTWIRTAASVAAVDDPGVPVRIAWGEQDRTIPFERYGAPYATALPYAGHITVPGVGHVPMYDDPALVARTILDVTRTADTNSRSTHMSATPSDFEIADGTHGKVVVRRWEPTSAPDKIVLVVHGYGEHGGRYAHVAEALADGGAVVFAPDHYGHGRSEGAPAVVEDIDAMAQDVGRVYAAAREQYPGLPVAMIGHSLGGMIATRFAQLGLGDLTALVLSGPVVGGNPDIIAMKDMDPMPDVPLDPAVLSRDPAVGEAYAADALVYHGPFARETLQGIADCVDAIAAGPSFGALPTLWLHGENDPLAPLEVTRAAMEHLRGDTFEEKVYAGAMHEIFNETNRDEVIADATGFVASGAVSRSAR
jgi:alpha-beta hydrolase superfamily lysophospholipase